MKKERSDTKTQTEILVTIWISVILSLSMAFFLYAQNDLIAFLGQKMKVIAIDIAQNTSLTPEEVAVLKGLDYESLVEHPLNQGFEAKARKLMGESNIKYIYLESTLPNAPYFIETPEEEKAYGFKIGTPLDAIFLLTASRSDEERLLDDGPRPYADKRRYSVMDAFTRRAFENQSSAYYRSKDLWGKYISGFAPLYDTEANYVGLIGVDLDIQVYYKALYKYAFIILFFIATNLTMVALLYQLAFKVQKHKERSDHDALTGIYNRGKIWEIMIENWYFHLKSGMSFCLVIVDLDYFKEYNDFYGHGPGDDVLIQVAKALKTEAALENGFVGRYGGDEFILVLPNVEPNRNDVISGRLLQAVKALDIRHENSPSKGQTLTVSIGGIVTVPNIDISIEELFIKADEALYVVKNEGRNGARIEALT